MQVVFLRHLDKSENEYNEYKFEIWQMGKKSSTYIFNDLDSARQFYVRNGQCDSFAIKLYINNKLINFMNMSNVLKISDFDKWRFNLLF